jgi:VacB/RNase II family 3'-5' exoribonuclease
MKERGLLPDFSSAAQAQAKNITTAAVDSAGKARDLRDLLWASIDNDDSRDLDQLTVSAPGKNGAVRVLVAIADVDSTVRRDTPIDDHARINTTSVYTAAEIFPMLPEKLSTDLTSLGEGEDRLAMVVDMTVTADGHVAESEIYRALVRNQAKLAYDSVAAWLDGAAPPPKRVTAVKGMEEQLRIQDRTARAMKTRRYERGSLALDTQKTRAVFDGDILSGLSTDTKNRAKDLIEDFMIAANTASADHLEKHRFPSLRRVLRVPDRWERIGELAASLGDELPLVPSARALAEFLSRRREAEPNTFSDLSLSVVKLLGRGEYVLKVPGQAVPGHFGLAVSDYTHSTAPNRRFPDVIEQRLLKASLAGNSIPYGHDELERLATHCTDQESNADRVERQVRKSAAALLLEGRVGERFDAIVTGASPKGTWVRILNPRVEGKLVSGFKGLDVGDRAKVELRHTDVEHGFIDFVRAR